jgi:hypothetical protein
VRAHDGARSGRSILIVEDEPLIALEVHAAFNAAGGSIVSSRLERTSRSPMEAPMLPPGTISL